MDRLAPLSVSVRTAADVEKGHESATAVDKSAGADNESAPADNKSAGAGDESAAGDKKAVAPCSSSALTSTTSPLSGRRVIAVATLGSPTHSKPPSCCEKAGAHGITIHLREDRRHIVDRDVSRIAAAVQTRLNLEMANAREIVEIALKTKPDIVCIVPERRQEVTTEGGLDVAGQLAHSRRRAVA